MFPHSSGMRLTFLVLCETFILVATFLIAAALRLGVGAEGFLEYEGLVPKALLSTLVLQLCLYMGDLYETFAAPRPLDLVLRLAQAFLVGTLVLALVYLGIPDLLVGRGILLLHLPLAFLATAGWRYLCLVVWGHEALCENLLVLGTGGSAQYLRRELLRRRPLGYRLAGFLGESPGEVGHRHPGGGPSVIGTLDDLPATLKRERISLIVVALEDFRGRLPVPQLLECRLRGIRVEDITTFSERLTGKILLSNLRPSWFIFSSGFDRPRFFPKVKRILEFAVALLALVVVSPLLLLLALLVRLDSRGPIFYRQERVGQKGLAFMLIKLRTMRTDAEAETGPIWARGDGDPRMTRTGRFLRMLRLDELPQLVNVLRGEMSFVGPRPERPHFVQKLRTVIPYYDERHSVKPGITGWAQIKFGYGSNLEDAEEKLQFDLYYIKHMSWFFDLGILFDTVKVMALGRGAR